MICSAMHAVISRNKCAVLEEEIAKMGELVRQRLVAYGRRKSTRVEVKALRLHGNQVQVLAGVRVDDSHGLMDRNTELPEIDRKRPASTSHASEPHGARY